MCAYAQVMCLQFVYVCVLVVHVYVAKKLTCFVPYRLEDSCCVYYTIQSWNLNTFKVVFYIQ